MVISTSGGPLPSGRIFNKLNRMHYQPFPPLTKALLQQKIAEGKRYLVCQTFPRGMKPGSCGSLLLRAYSALEKDQAEAHLLSLSSDPNARIYDLVDPHHLKALWQAATQPAGYKVYYAGKKGAGWRPPPPFIAKIKRYLQQRHPAWKSTAYQKIQTGLHEHFGALFLIFSFKDDTDRVPLEEIDKY